MKIEKQIVGLCGEYFVAAELLKRNFQVAVTLGNAKSIDLIARNETTKTSYNIGVKTLRKKPNCFTLHTSKLEENTIYFFVYLNDENQEPDYYILTGTELLSNILHYYGASYRRVDNRETINHGPLKIHKSRWDKLSA